MQEPPRVDRRGARPGAYTRSGSARWAASTWSRKTSSRRPSAFSDVGRQIRRAV